MTRIKAKTSVPPKGWAPAPYKAKEPEWFSISAPYWTSGAPPVTTSSTITVSGTSTWPSSWGGGITGGVAIGSGWSAWSGRYGFYGEYDLTEEELRLVKGAVIDEVLRAWLP